MAESTSPSAKRRRIDYEKAFKVKIGNGDHQKILTIYDDFVVHRSTFFKSARSSAWFDEATPVDLTDEEPDIFATYMHCVQFEEVDVPNTPCGLPDFATLFKLYVFADKMGDLRAANAFMDRLISRRTISTNKGGQTTKL
ncbi:hypothetical protein B0A48_01364 [Cryoendolithus antarcticus]|uniref:BTB domain-containing protein n=1 Tax=Cryoendolithus antarcticus TaxID=1507870 RepID=A0A1V8TSY0_9PEZI|nr:hypothetical protein B0A48_01364 [Cryoendolithus antarcticus]